MSIRRLTQNHASDLIAASRSLLIEKDDMNTTLTSSLVLLLAVMLVTRMTVVRMMSVKVPVPSAYARASCGKLDER